jgi:hypothetical protein
MTEKNIKAKVQVQINLEAEEGTLEELTEYLGQVS